MSKFIVFRVPEWAWEGLDYLYNLIELKPNDLGFAVITAKNMEMARRKYFDEFYFSSMEEEDKEHSARKALEHIFDDFDEMDLITLFGEDEGKIIWNMIDDDDTVTAKIAMQTLKKLSERSIKELCFLHLQMTFAVSSIDFQG